MKLARKGLLVVGVPLIFQVLIVGVFIVLIWQAQQLAAEQERAASVVSQINRLANLFSSIIEKSGRTNSDSVPAYSELNADLSSIESSVRSLSDQLAKNPKQSVNIRRLVRLQQKFSDEMKIFATATNTTDAVVRESADLLLFKMFLTAQHVFDVANEMIAVEDVNNQQFHNKADSRMLIRIWMLIAVTISIISTVCLAYFASKSIRRPIEQLALNAMRISKREPLPALIEGRDELAHFDKILHSVDFSVEQALTSERNLITHAADIVLSVDDEGIINNANPYVERMLGRSRKQLAGTSIYNLIAERDLRLAREIFASRTADGGNMVHELGIKSDRGEIIDTAWRCIWSEREATFFCVAHDITERKHIEHLKQEFIAMLSQDLREPLMSVLNSLQLVQAGTTGPVTPEAMIELNQIEHGIDHLIKVVNELLDFEKLQATGMEFEMVPVKLNEIIEQSVQLVQALAAERQVQISVGNGDIMVLADARKLTQLLVNFLSNALKHSPEHSRIFVEVCEKHEEDGAGKDAVREDGVDAVGKDAVGKDAVGKDAVEKGAVGKDAVEVVVHDEGPGVPHAYAEKIFAPFEQIDERPTAALGTGLGLAICKLIIEGHGGKVGVRDSDKLCGSAFWLTLSPQKSRTSIQLSSAD